MKPFFQAEAEPKPNREQQAILVFAYLPFNLMTINVLFLFQDQLAESYIVKAIHQMRDGQFECEFESSFATYYELIVIEKFLKSDYEVVKEIPAGRTYPKLYELRWSEKIWMDEAKLLNTYKNQSKSIVQMIADAKYVIQIE